MPPPSPSPNSLPRVLESLLLAAVFVVLARAGQVFAIPPGYVPAGWLPSGIALVALLARGLSLWPGVFLGAFVSSLWSLTMAEGRAPFELALPAALANGVGDTWGATLAAHLIVTRAGTTRPSHTRLPSLLWFLLTGVCLSSAISTLFGTTSLAGVGLLPWREFVYAFATWFLAHGLGVLLLAPPILVWLRPAPPLAEGGSPGTTASTVFDLEALAFIAVMTLTSAHCMGLLPLGLPVTLPLVTLTPLFMWGVFRLDARVTLPMMGVVAVLGHIAVLLGTGRFAGMAPAHALTALQLFLATMSATVLFFQTVSDERRASRDELESLNAALERRVAERTDAFRSEFTARRMAEEAQVRLERQLLQAQKIESLGMLAGGMAHDYNNLLTVILANAEVALLRLNGEGALGGPARAEDRLAEGSGARAHLLQIIDAAQRSAALTRQMLAYSGKGAFQMSDVDLGEHVRAMREILRVATDRGVEPTLRIDGTNLVVHADPSQLDQLLMNLVINAAEALHAGEGEIGIEVSAVDLDAAALAGASAGSDRPPGRYIRLRVSDTGCGMDTATVQRIFDPFFTSKSIGRGLGMAVVLGIVRGHEGAIRVETTVGAGTTFDVLLPARGPYSTGSSTHSSPSR